MTAAVFDDRACSLGEGPLWHPLRRQLFWFDILEKKLLTRGQDGPAEWAFDEPVSAAGWIDADHLLIASATGLWRLNLHDGTRVLISPLEKDNSITRSNDGRADPWGGFWIGTMGRNAEARAGSIYRFYQGTLKRLFGDITISNAICFAPDRSCAYFTDTSTGQVMKVELDRSGWPDGNASVFLDLAPEGLNPDGAVVDAEGTIWIAQWGAARVAAYSKEGAFRRAIDLPALHVTCPAFGGPDFTDLYVTSALQGVPEDLRRQSPDQGMTFLIQGGLKGLPEPKVML
jgi:sugar lactone lactonase YvrE